MEVALELEDDLFFADLSKQISLLIMDDDEDPVANYPTVSFQDFSRVNYPVAPNPYMFEQVHQRESKGTGVFIPRSSQPRRKQRQGSYNGSSHTRSRRQNYSNTKMVSQPSYTNNLNPNRVRGYSYTSSTTVHDSRN